MRGPVPAPGSRGEPDEQHVHPAQLLAGQQGVPAPLLAQSNAQRSIRGKTSGPPPPCCTPVCAGMWKCGALGSRNKLNARCRESNGRIASVQTAWDGVGVLGGFQRGAVPKGKGTLLNRNLPCSKLQVEMNSTEYSLFH